MIPNLQRNFSQLIIFLLALLFYSCDSYHFSQPQPVDKENIYEFPDDFIGKWIEKNDSDSDWYFLDKKGILLVTHTRQNIVTGAWPQLNKKGDYLRLPASYEGFKTINYDSLNKPIDTIENYLLSGEHIYPFESARFLTRGYTYIANQDTFLVFKNDTLCIDLGRNAFLRRLNENFYVLNIRNRILGETKAEFNDWWQIMLLENNKGQSVRIWQSTSKSRELSCMFYPRNATAAAFYYDCMWTSADILRLANEGYFDICTELIKVKRTPITK